MSKVSLSISNRCNYVRHKISTKIDQAKSNFSNRAVLLRRTVEKLNQIENNRLIVKNPARKCNARQRVTQWKRGGEVRSVRFLRTRVNPRYSTTVRSSSIFSFRNESFNGRRVFIALVAREPDGSPLSPYFRCS